MLKRRKTSEKSIYIYVEVQFERERAANSKKAMSRGSKGRERPRINPSNEGARATHTLRGRYLVGTPLCTYIICTYMCPLPTHSKFLRASVFGIFGQKRPFRSGVRHHIGQKTKQMQQKCDEQLKEHKSTVETSWKL